MDGGSLRPSWLLCKVGVVRVAVRLEREREGEGGVVVDSWYPVLTPLLVQRPTQQLEGEGETSISTPPRQI